MTPLRTVIVGAAGQARECAWYLEEINRSQAQNTFTLVGFVVSDRTLLGPRDSSERVVGDYAWLEAHRGDVDALVLGIGTPAARLKVAGELAAEFPDLVWPTIIHPSARYDTATLKLDRGSLLAPNVLVTVNVGIGPFAMLNFGCTVGHETRIGAGSVINPGANLSGGVTIGEGCLVGAGAVILQYRTVGEGAVVGAGAVVTKDVPAGVTVVGVPAGPLRSAIP